MIIRNTLYGPEEIHDTKQTQKGTFVNNTKTSQIGGETVRERQSLSDALKNGYDTIFGKQWPIWVGGILFGMINVFMFAFERPWSSANGIRNWGNWFLTVLKLLTSQLFPHIFFLHHF